MTDNPYLQLPGLRVGQASPAIQQIRNDLQQRGFVSTDEQDLNVLTPALLNTLRLLRAMKPPIAAESIPTLPQEDVLTGEDIATLGEPRCGTPGFNSDILNQYRRSLDGATLRELLPMYSAKEVPWDTASLKFAFKDCSSLTLHSSITVATAQDAVRRAAITWNAIGLPIAIVESSIQSADIVIDWLLSHNDPESLFSITSPTHAHADFPPGNMRYGPPLPLHFNASFSWSVAGDDVFNFDVETIALHEFGHCLGLFHRGASTLMFDRLKKGDTIRTIDNDTKGAALALYASSVHI